MRRGEISLRIDPFYNLPEHRELVARLLRFASSSAPIRDRRVSARIVEGRITPVDGSYSELTGHPVFLRAQNVSEGHLDFSDAKRLLPDVFLQDRDSILGDNDIVLTIDGVQLGKAAVHRAGEESCCVSNHMVRILPGEDIEADYLAFFINSPTGQSQIKRGITGSAIPGIRTDAIGRILVPLVKRGKQRELVDAMEAARAARRAKLAEADALLAGLDACLLETLGLALPPADGRRSFALTLGALREQARLGPDYFHPERVLAIRAMEAASSRMACAKLSDIVAFVRDQIKTPDENYIGLAGVQSRTGELSGVEEEAEGTCFTFQQGDVLFARLRPYLNKVWCADSSGCCSPEFHVLRVINEKSLQPEYLAAVLRSGLILAQTRHMMTGNTHPRLAKEDVVNLVVPIPDPVIQQSIAVEIRRRRERARALHAEAEQGWTAAKQWFEEQLLGPAP